ncbi:MAG: hypothetical protein LUE31_07280 [Lachnospiraceae bacterium]|nr:hypothetical protein [Lachnospiraceae bacterium]
METEQMGFIDYQGTKKDRYEEVLAFAKAQQEEEARRRGGARAGSRPEAGASQEGRAASEHGTQPQEGLIIPGQEPQPESKETTALSEQGSQPDVWKPSNLPGQNAGNPARPQFDRERFQALLEEKRLPAYAEAFGLLRKCPLPEEMGGFYGELSDRLLVLQEALDKFQESCQPDLFLFYEYYIPEALRLAVAYIGYLDGGAGEKTLNETGAEVLDAAKRLLLAVNEKIDEIYQFAAMETKAEARALESMLNQAGYIDPEYRIK